MSNLPQKMSVALRMENDGNFVGALAAYGACIAQNPADLRAWTRVGMIFVRLLKWQQAAENFEFVVDQQADNAEALHGLAIALYHLGNHARARELADRAAAVAPKDWRIHASRAYIHATTQSDPAATLAAYRDWGRRFADPLTAAARPLPKLDAQQRDPQRRLRIGYVSGDLREHSVAFFMEPVFANHSKAVEIFVYSTGARDAITDRIAAHVPNWFDVRKHDDNALLALIRKHRIDVLVDLSGHTEGQRLFVFARRAAPVQATWLGFMHPLGMKAMDYRLTDWGCDPQGNEAHHSETLFRLECMASYAPPDAPLLTEPPMLRNGFPTLVSLNNSKKITDEMLSLWGRILAARPDAQLLLMVQERSAADAQSQMQPRLARLGLPIDRIHISPQLPLAEFMQLGCIADVALDTSPVSGGTTTLHALWMGLPLVTLDAQESSASSSARTLQGMGYGAWVAQNADEYIAHVLALLDSPDRLREHRSTVRDRMRANALMDYAGRTAELETAYRLMWINHVTGSKRYLHLRHDLQEAYAGHAAQAGISAPAMGDA
jgi:protein O-GlcNAc transferase